MVWCTNNTISTSNMTTLKLSSFSHLIKSHKHHPTDIWPGFDQRERKYQLGELQWKDVRQDPPQACSPTRRGNTWGTTCTCHVITIILKSKPRWINVTCSPLEKHHNHPVGQRGVQVAIRAPEQRSRVQKSEIEDQGTNWVLKKIWCLTRNLCSNPLLIVNR